MKSLGRMLLMAKEIGIEARQVARDATLVGLEELLMYGLKGAAAYNEGLSERRAKTVHDYLIDLGIAEDRLTWRGYGESSPIADNETAEGRQQNRRVVLRILSR